MLFNKGVTRRLEIYILLIIFLIFYNDSNSVKALIGHNIRRAPENEFRFVISIATVCNDSRPAERTHRCTASLISRQDALTSAHCLATVEVDGFKLLVGSHDLRQSLPFYCQWWWSYNYWAQQRNIEPDFRQNDIAFIKIMGNIPYEIPYTNIANIENNRLYNQDVVTATWGEINIGRIPRNLRTATLRIITNEECGQRITALGGRRYRVHERRLCTIAEPFVLLQGGDSGGPLLYNGAIVGINHGTGPKIEGLQFHPEQTNLHFGIQYYRDFILDVRHNTQTHFVAP